MGPTATALAGFAGWYLLLTLALGMYRSALIFGGQKAANSFAADGSDVSPFGRRLTRARDNCYENLPVFAALALAASLAGRIAVTDPLAMTVLYARIGQSLTHVISTSVPAVLVRANLFFLQMLIYLYWSFRLLA